MNILSIGSRYKPYKGGNAKRVSIICENFSKLGHNIFVVTTSEKGAFNDNLYKSETGVTILRFTKSSTSLLKLNKIINKYKIDVVYTHNTRVWIFCSIFLPCKIKLVNEVHALNNSSFFKNFAMYISIPILQKRTDAIFVLSNNAKNILYNNYKFDKSKIYFTPNGIENEEINSLDFGRNNNFIYAYGGTLYDWQGINILLSKSKEILEIAEDVIIKIIGGGPLLEDVKSFVVKENLEKRIIITGFVSEEEYNKQLKLSDVLLIPRPSTIATETAIPLKIFDAIKVNKPIIMSNVSGLTEVLGYNEALIYQHDHYEELVQCCRRLYRNFDLANKLCTNAKDQLKLWPSNIDIAKKQVDIISHLVK